MHAPQTRTSPTVAADILERLRERRPRVHCITNAVAQNFTANMLLAAGAMPSMTIAPEEVGPSWRAPTRCWSISAPSTPNGRRQRCIAIAEARKAAGPLGARSGADRPLEPRAAFARSAA